MPSLVIPLIVSSQHPVAKGGRYLYARCDQDGQTKNVYKLFLTYFLDIIQIWERSEQGFRGFQGCGSVWLPMAPGQHHIDISLWKPTSGGLEGLSGTIPLLVLALAVIMLMFANPFPLRNRDANSHYPGPHGHARADHEPFSQVTDNHCHRRNSPAEFEHYLVWLQPVWCGNMLVHRLTFSDVVLSSVNTVTFYLWL